MLCCLDAGMMQAIQNLGLALMSIVVGNLLDYKGYLITETFFILCLGVALIAGALLFLAYALLLLFYLFNAYTRYSTGEANYKLTFYEIFYGYTT